MYLMFADTSVLYFDFDDFIVEVINEQFLPYSLQGKFVKSVNPKDLLKNIQYLKSWLSRRVLSLSRANAKQIYTMYQIPQLDDIETRVKICLACKGVAIQDCYWIAKSESEKYVDVNIRHKHFKEILEISLLGINHTVTENSICPELTTHGLFRKCWVRDDNDLYLLKSDNFQNNISTRMEVLASKILDCLSTNLSIVEYTGRVRNTKVGKLYVSKCKNFITDDYSFVEAWEIIEYCNTYNINFRQYMYSLDRNLADIPVLDFILVNTDRHTQNYGFLVDNKTNKIVSLAPIFDFNCALVADYFGRSAEDTLSQMFNSKETLRQLAEQYISYSNVGLNINKFNKLRGSYSEYKHIFDEVYKRCLYLKIV